MKTLMTTLFLVLVMSTSYPRTPGKLDPVRVLQFGFLENLKIGEVATLCIKIEAEIDIQGDLLTLFPNGVIERISDEGIGADLSHIVLKKHEIVTKYYQLRVINNGFAKLELIFRSQNSNRGYSASVEDYLNVTLKNNKSRINRKNDARDRHALDTTRRNYGNISNDYKKKEILSLHSVNVTGRVYYTDQFFSERGLYNTPVELWFKDTDNQQEPWYHPVPTSNDCFGDKHVHYDYPDINGNYSFSFTFNGNISDYDELWILVRRDNTACWLDSEPNEIAMQCNWNTVIEYFSAAESGVTAINSSQSDISLSNIDISVNGPDGQILRGLALSKEFINERYSNNIPINIPKIFVTQGLNDEWAGMYIGTGNGTTPRIEIYNSMTDFSTVMHEYGHYVNARMWGGNSLSYGNDQVITEGWAVFYSMCSRCYAERRYSDQEAMFEDDNLEIGPYDTPRYDWLRYESINEDISEFACHLWSLYDGYEETIYEYTDYIGDNDDIDGLSLRVFEKFRNLTLVSVEGFRAEFKSGLDQELQNSIDILWANLLGSTNVKIRSAQVGSLHAEAVSKQEVKFVWTTQNYTANTIATAMRNLPDGYHLYRQIGGQWNNVGTIPMNNTEYTYADQSPSGLYRMSSYNSSEDSYKPLDISVGSIRKIELLVAHLDGGGNADNRYSIGGVDAGASIIIYYIEGNPPINVTAIPQSAESIFVMWSDGSTVNPRTISPSTDISVYAIFKLHMNSGMMTSLTSSEGPTCTNNQRKLSHIPGGAGSFGEYHATYDGLDKVWFTISTDYGSSWSAEKRVSATTRCANHGSLFSDADSTWITWKEYDADAQVHNICVGKIIQLPGQLLRKYSSPTVAPYEDATPVIYKGVDDGETIIFVIYEAADRMLAYAAYREGVLIENDEFGPLSSDDPVQERPSVAGTGNYNSFEFAWFEEGNIKYRLADFSLFNNQLLLNYYTPVDVPHAGQYALGAPSIAHYVNPNNPDGELNLVAFESGSAGYSMISLAGWFSGQGWLVIQSFMSQSEDWRLWAPTASLINAAPVQSSLENIRIAANATYPIYLPTPNTAQIWTFGYKDDPPNGYQWIIDMQKDDALHPSAVVNPDPGFGTDVFTSNVFGTTKVIDVAMQGMNKAARKINLTRARDLIIMKDSAFVRIGIGGMHIKQNGSRVELDWDHGYDTVVIGKTITVENEYRTKPFILSSGMQIKYQDRLIKMGANTFPSSLTIAVEMVNSSTGSIIATLDQHNVNGMNIGRVRRTRSHGISQFYGTEVYLRYHILGSLDSVKIYGEDFYSVFDTSASVFPKEAGEVIVKAVIPDRIELEQNFPNPFNPTTEIGYSIPDVQRVSVIVKDMLGRTVKEYDRGIQTPGRYTLQLDARDLKSGVYFYTLQTGAGSVTKKMTLLK